MRSLRAPIPAVLGILLSLVCAAAAFGQRVYSYVDENGIRVFTNIPPKNARNDDQPALNAKSGTALPVTTDSHEREHLNTIIDKYADQYKLDPKLVRSIIASESGFNSRAVSRKGAQGLMQLMPGTASRLGVRNPFDPEENIRGGMEHLRTLLNTFDNDLTLSLAAYNAGENLVQRIRRVPDFPETKAYVHTVTTRYGQKEMTIQPSQPPAPRYFRWLDEQGILHLTNVVPAQRSDAENGLWWGQSGQ